MRIVQSWPAQLTDEQFGELELLACEVITNAVRCTRAPCAVVVRWTGVRVRVEVTDVDAERPKPRYASPEEENGRGLLLVETLATAWGSAPLPAGKVVWFEVGPPDTTPPTTDLRLAEQPFGALPFSSPHHSTLDLDRTQPGKAP